jgi:hypothetical protein
VYCEPWDVVGIDEECEYPGGMVKSFLGAALVVLVDFKQRDRFFSILYAGDQMVSVF